ncbi:MAG: cytochrome c556 [Gammaproteobacteria bacterium]|jgi:cytochrome c556
MRTVLKVVLMAAVMAAPMSAMSDDEGEVKYRKGVMKAISGHAGAIAQIANGKVSHDAALMGHAHALVEVSKQVSAAFKNKAMGHKSTADGKVWSDWAGFDGKAGDLERAALAVATAAKSGPGAVKGKLKDLFATCKGCHKDYRVKKKK